MSDDAWPPLKELDALMLSTSPTDQVSARRLALRVTGKIADPATAAWLHDELCEIISLHAIDQEAALHRYDFLAPVLAGKVAQNQPN